MSERRATNFSQAFERSGRVGHFERKGLIFLIPSLQGGGAEKVASELLPYLSEKFRITLALLQDKWDYKPSREIATISFSPPLSSNVAHIARLPYHVVSLAALIRNTRTNVVLSFMEQANLINILCSLFTSHSAVISQRIMPQLQYRRKGWLGRAMLFGSRMLYPRASHITAVSNEIRNFLLSSYRINSEKVSFTPNPVNIKNLQEQAREPLPFPVRKPYILHVGRFSVEHKAQDIVLEVFSRLKVRNDSLSLVFVGEGADREKIISFTQSLNLSHAVYFAGWQENVATFMANADLLLLPSRREGWPNVLVESMACGCPVVSSDCQSGPREIIGNDLYGLLTPVNDVEALCNAASRLLEDIDLAAHFREQGYRRAREFGVERISSEYVRLIERFA